MANSVLYKLTSGTDVIKGGEFRRGFNAVSLETKDLFREPGAHPYILEFKAGDLVVRREIVLGVQMSAAGSLRKPEASSRPVELRTEMAYAFTKKNAMGRDIEVRAQLSLGLRSIQFLPFSLLKEPSGGNRPEAPRDQR